MDFASSMYIESVAFAQSICIGKSFVIHRKIRENREAFLSQYSSFCC